jgi:hypothetical protein
MYDGSDAMVSMVDEDMKSEKWMIVAQPLTTPTISEIGL